MLAVGAVDRLDGVSVECADDLLGALARIADGGIDVVLLSLDLPDGQGPDAVRAIAERAPDLPVVAVADGEAGRRALDAGADDVVPPDADGELVERTVRYAAALRRMRTEFDRREFVDPVTGLYTARGFEAFAAHHVALADRTRQPLVLVSVRIEDLGPPGEPARDRSLAETAEVLRAAVRDGDILGHLGDGSFCALLTGGAAGAETLVLSRIVDVLAVRNARAGAERLSLSVGAATYDPERPVPLDELVAAAERGEGGP